MLPIYPASIIRQWDEFTINNEPIASIDLMEKAAVACVSWITKNISTQNKITIVCGNGNNGGDGLAISRLLLSLNYKVHVYIKDNTKRSEDNAINSEKLKNKGNAEIEPIDENGTIFFQKSEVIIDCIFGTGLDRPVTGFWKNVIDSVNISNCRVISIDIPSGLISEPGPEVPGKNESIIKAHTTLTFQTPKLSMLIPGWGNYCGNVDVLDIGLSPGFISQNLTDHFFVAPDDIIEKFKKREKFSHKGTFGHALIVAGNTGKCGAAILSSKACIKTGAGLVTVHTYKDCSISIHTAIPEVMIESLDSEMPDFSRYSSIGIGPGIGTGEEQKVLLKTVIQNSKKPLLLDADALTLLSQNIGDFKLPANAILTPHSKEFDRLAGESKDAFERLKKAQLFSKTSQCILILKGAYTAICSPDGKTYFNSTGNPGMATAGCGDVLTGIITSLLAQGYSPLDAAICGVFIHGKAGDIAAEKKSMTGMVASDIIENLGEVLKRLESN